jgi:hypothetical protein
MSAKKKKQSPASLLDRHKLYEYSVQCPESEVDFIETTYQQLRGKPLRLLREDFCGTAAVCCDWVKRDKNNISIGIDLDNEVLDWGRKNNLSQLSAKEQSRVLLLKENVLSAKTSPVDAIAAMNFSYWLFKKRKDLKAYFKRAYKALRKNGVLFLDAYGGYESFQEIIEEREIDEDGFEFTYIWEQESFNPVDNGLICSISFDFPDGTGIQQAFYYDWRLWTLPEIRDILEECGFSKITTYWQGNDENGDEDGDFKPVTEADADAGWICYMTAEK